MRVCLIGSTESVVNIIRILKKKKKKKVFFNNKEILYNALLILVLTVTLFSMLKIKVIPVMYNYGGIGLVLMKQSFIAITLDPESLIQFPSPSVIHAVCTTLSPPLLDNSLLRIFPQINMYINGYFP